MVLNELAIEINTVLNASANARAHASFLELASLAIWGRIKCHGFPELVVRILELCVCRSKPSCTSGMSAREANVRVASAKQAFPTVRGLVEVRFFVHEKGTRTLGDPLTSVQGDGTPP